jgi:hypothetical protein
MAISVFPAPAASGGGGVSAFAAAIPALSTTYEHIQNFEAGVYSVAVAPTSTNAALSFVNATGLLNNVATTSGIVSFTMASPATRVFITLAPGGTPGAIVTINKTANPLSPDDVGNGTVDTINATGTYNQTGLLGVLLIGGGAAGERGLGPNEGVYQGQPGGRAGFINAGFVVANAPTTVTVGAKGVAANTNNESIVPPTNSSFGNLLTTNAASNIFTNGNGGGSSGDSNNPGNPGNASSIFLSWGNGNSTTGGGGAAGSRRGSGSGAGGGSGIGTGGTGASGTGNYTNFRANVAATNATGKGAGGGGGCYATNGSPNDVGRFGSDGSDGVVYVVRGF